ncbi:hypothetical protein HDU81_002809 [Chytriomyces hyalinus]|nr:hypothetical protein HDU81_002809 [Chytriomyces hyalinus]
MNDLDWLADESDPSVEEREFTALQRVHGVNGYREGVEAGRQVAMQEGFNQGFDATFERALKRGSELGAAAARRCLEAVANKDKP